MLWEEGYYFEGMQNENGSSAGYQAIVSLLKFEACDLWLGEVHPSIRACLINSQSVGVETSQLVWLYFFFSNFQ